MSSSPSIITTLVTTLLAGGLGTGIGALVTGRANARKTTTEAKAIDAKLPAEVDSVVVQGAEAAVLTMRSALESATNRIAQLEQEREGDRKRIAELEAKVEDLRRKVETAERALGDARLAGQELRRELEAFVKDQKERR